MRRFIDITFIQCQCKDVCEQDGSTALLPPLYIPPRLIGRLVVCQCLPDCGGGAEPSPIAQGRRAPRVFPGSRVIPDGLQLRLSVLLRGRASSWESSRTGSFHRGRQQDVPGLLERSARPTQKLQHLLPGSEQCGEGQHAHTHTHNVSQLECITHYCCPAF